MITLGQVRLSPATLPTIVVRPSQHAVSTGVILAVLEKVVLAHMGTFAGQLSAHAPDCHDANDHGGLRSHATGVRDGGEESRPSMLAPRSQEADRAALYASTRPSERQPQPFCLSVRPAPTPVPGLAWSRPSKKSRITVSLDLPWANRMCSAARASPVRAPVALQAWHDAVRGMAGLAETGCAC